MVLRGTGKPLKHEPLTELLDNLEANALHTLPPVSIHLRWAPDNDQLVLDPGWPNADRILVKRSGWTIGRADHVRFRRPSGFGALPRPGSGKGLGRLTQLLGLEGRNAILFVVFLMNCMRPNGPYMFLMVEGVQGSGKSALSTVIRRIVDPNAVPKGRLPKNEHELMIIASENFLLVFDNASGVRWDMSDSLCAIATASGFSTRKYYTDNELRTFLVCRPVLLNGIGQFADPLVLAIIEIVQEVRAARLGEGYRGRVSELLSALRNDDRYVEKWVPGTPSHLSNQLKRLIPAFAILGVTIDFPTRNNRGQEVEITFVSGGIAATMIERGVLNEEGRISGRAQAAVRLLSPADFECASCAQDRAKAETATRFVRSADRGWYIPVLQ